MVPRSSPPLRAEECETVEILITYVSEIFAGKFGISDRKTYICNRKTARMILGFNIQAWWWRSLTLVNNQYDGVHV